MLPICACATSTAEESSYTERQNQGLIHDRYTIDEVSTCHGANSCPNNFLAMTVMSIPLAAQGFADDFSRNSLRYALERAPGSSGLGQVEVVERGLRFSARVISSGRDDVHMAVAGPTDKFTARLVLGGSTAVTAVDGEAGAGISGMLYSDTAGVAASPAGRVFAELALFVKADGERGVRLCLDRRDENDASGPLGVFGDQLCEVLDGFSPRVEVEHALGLALDRDAGTLTATLDSVQRVIVLPGEVFEASDRSMFLRVYQEGGAGQVSVDILGVETDGLVDDFSISPPAFPGYEPLSNRGGAGEQTVDIDAATERARFSLTGRPDQGYRQVTLRPQIASDYLEGILSLDTSELPTDSRATLRLQGRFYNDTSAPPDPPGDAVSGDVRGIVQLARVRDDRILAQYCLWRESIEPGVGFEPLLHPERPCLDFGIQAESRVGYRASITLDRASGGMKFSLGDVSRVHAISTPVNDVARPRFNILLSMAGAGVAVGYLDDFRTAPDALTPGESGEWPEPYIHASETTSDVSPVPRPSDDGQNETDDVGVAGDPGVDVQSPESDVGEPAVDVGDADVDAGDSGNESDESGVAMDDPEVGGSGPDVDVAEPETNGDGSGSDVQDPEADGTDADGDIEGNTDGNAPADADADAATEVDSGSSSGSVSGSDAEDSGVVVLPVDSDGNSGSGGCSIGRIDGSGEHPLLALWVSLGIWAACGRGRSTLREARPSAAQRR